MAIVRWLDVFMGFKHNNCASGPLLPPNKMRNETGTEPHAVPVFCENALSFD